MSVYFLHSGYADHHIEQTYAFNAELGLGDGNECISVGRHTLNEGNKRGDWTKHWMMSQVVRGEINKKTAYIQARSFMARALEVNGKARQAQGEAKVV